MKTLHKYLTLQVLATLVMTVGVFTFVLLLGNVLQGILKLLVNGQVGAWIVLKAVVLLVPFVLVYALPIGFIAATLLVFGRFSADQELNAARASGISLLSLSMPILLLSLLCCCVSAWINMEVGPRSRIAYKNLINEARSEFSSAQLPEGTPVYDFPGYMFLIDKNRHGNLEGVQIWIYGNNTNTADSYLRAPRGKIETDPVQKQLLVHLYDAQSVTLSGDHTAFSMSPEVILPPFPLSTTNKPSTPSIGDMTFSQLQDAKRELEEKFNLPPETTSNTDAARAQIAMAAKLRSEAMERILVEMNRQIAFSFACFGFALVGIPLGIQVHRRETNIGIAIALILVLVYYSFVILGGALAGRPEFNPHLIFWLPNFIFQAVGVVLLWRANGATRQ